MRRRPAALLAVAGVALSACGATTTGTPATSTGGTDSRAGAITVFAAASLKETFTTLGHMYEAAHPGARVTFDFGASSTLATQITQGAPADVFAAASQATMQTVTSAGDAVGTPRVFAVNTLEIATPTSPTTRVTSLADLARPAVKVAICQVSVPCGAAARTLFDRSHLAVTPVSEEVDVKSVLTKVELGEVDAGLVYVTDVRSAQGRVVGVAIPKDQNVTTTYPIAA
ncbi:MAG TPA: molybdate ABC transporter substrate-binding protein, partial [Candidatus Angelobacter sp.]|nr:molybdate ABC transporter substrate-binding protein [Candidatus Angelobacter sp.]